MAEAGWRASVEASFAVRTHRGRNQRGNEDTRLRTGEGNQSQQTTEITLKLF